MKMTMPEPFSNAPEQMLQELYPELTPEQLSEAAYYLKRYLDWVVRLAERQRNLTDLEEASSMSMK